MAIRTVVTRGFGNGTYNGTISEVVTRGYSIGAILVPSLPGLEFTLADNRQHYTLDDNRQHYTLEDE